MGKNCERSVCENNPCKFGATCVIYPGSGFICLCPLGKHGMYCEHGKYCCNMSFDKSRVGTFNGFTPILTIFGHFFNEIDLLVTLQFFLSGVLYKILVEIAIFLFIKLVFKSITIISLITINECSSSITYLLNLIYYK